MAEISVALGGGGVKGIAHFGVLNRLEQAGFKIRAIAGTSAGGVAGSVFAAGYSQTDILKALKRINQRNFFARLPNDGPSLLGLAGLIEVLSSYLDNKTFQDLKIPFAVTAVDIDSKQEYIIRQGSVKDAVLATVAIPGVFPPKKIGGTNLVDGGVLDPVPVAVARWLAPTLPVVAVCLSPTPEKWSELPEFQAPETIHIPGPILEQISRLRISQALRIFVSSMEITMHMVGETRMQIEKPDVIIRPKVHHIGILDTVDPQELVNLGDLAGKEAIPQIRSSLAWRHQLSRQFHDRTPPGKVLDDQSSGKK